MTDRESVLIAYGEPALWQQGGRVDRPEAWYAARTRRRFTLFGLVLGLVVSMVLSVNLRTAHLERSAAGRWGMLLFVSLVLATVLIGLAVRKPRRCRMGPTSIRHKQRSLVFVAYRLWAPWSAFGVFVAFAVAFVAVPIVIGVVTSDYGSPVYRNREVIGFAVYAAVLTTPYWLGSALRGRFQPGLGVAPDGVHQWGWFRHHFYRWDDLNDLEVVVHPVGILIRIATERRTSGGARGTAESRSPGGGAQHRTLSRAGGLRTDPVAVQQMLTHYLHHPDDRAELGNPDQAAQRHWPG